MPITSQIKTMIERLDFEIEITEPRTWYERMVGLHHTRYILKTEMRYHSRRFNRNLTCPVGMDSDGASGPAIDVVSQAWWFHDRACGWQHWDDGTYITAYERSMILHDILQREGRQVRAVTWTPVVWLWSALTNNGVKR